MSKRYVFTLPDGRLAITELSEQPGPNKESRLAKTLFELSRTTDMITRFDPVVHTLDAIAAGIDGHHALALAGECEDSDLPSDRYFRNAWEWS